MVKSALLHPELLRALACAGHGSKVLIADSNFPFNTGKNPEAIVVYLNLCPGKLSACDVLEALADEIPIESIEVLSPDGGTEPGFYSDFKRMAGGKELTKRGRSLFFDHAKAHECFLVIATGDESPYANVLLTIGVVPPHTVPS